MAEREIDIGELASLIADILEERFLARKCCPSSVAEGACALTPEEQNAVREILKTKKNAVRVFLYVLGAIALWILKDIYFYVTDHLAIK